MELKDKIIIILNIVTLVVSVLAIISSIYSINLSHKNNVEFSKYNITNEEQYDLIKNLDQMENYIDGLMSKYNILSGNENQEFLTKISEDERLNINTFISNINITLARMYFVMPDKMYKYISDNWSSDKNSLKDLKEKLYVIMRKSQYPNTKFPNKSDIKFLNKFDRIIQHK